MFNETVKLAEENRRRNRRTLLIRLPERPTRALLFLLPKNQPSYTFTYVGEAAGQGFTLEVELPG